MRHALNVKERNSRRLDHDILEIWKRTNYNDILWTFIANVNERHIEVRIHGEVLDALRALSVNGDTSGMLGDYFTRAAANISLWIDSDILIFDKDERTENVYRSYVQVPTFFVKIMYVVFSISAILLFFLVVCFVIRLVFTSEIIDGLIVFSLFAFLVNATIGCASVLFGWHRLRRNQAVIDNMATLSFIPIL